MTEWLKLALGGAVQNAVPIIFIGFISWRVSRIEKKMDSFISKEVVGALKEAADKEHAAIRSAQQESITSLRREINGLRSQQ